ncbi:MAG: diguanylate cyclase, partial [Erysipelotrichaceae bacterium]|nr:diguanylate cyclase [Erysipelotrichaceae bacterium]
GMRLIVSIPVSDTDGDWQNLIREILIVSAVVLLTMGIFTMVYAGHIIKPLVDLTHAAEQAAQGNYDFDLEYSKDDEIGRLTTIFKRMARHTKDHISDLNKRVYVDALTSVKNKGAFSDALDDLQTGLNNHNDTPFAIGMFDCDDLKAVNDQFGHDKGDIYLKTACRLICNVFHHSPVFRIGGDEFAVILRNDDYENREELIRSFHESAEKISASAGNKWEQVCIAMGIAEYDPQADRLVIDTVRRADRLMYADKRARKQDPLRGTVRSR